MIAWYGSLNLVAPSPRLWTRSTELTSSTRPSRKECARRSHRNLRKEQNLRMAQVPPQIFISYRREDGGHAGRLHADLAARFGEDAVFYDLHGIPAGVDFA